MKRVFMFGMLVLSVMCMTSCYPEGTEYVHGQDIALTHYDENVDFADYKTFVVPDSVVVVQSNGDSVRVAPEVQEHILALVKQNFTDRDYQILSAGDAQGQKPDFVVTITAFATPGFHDTGWGNYWGWYPGWNWFGWESFHPSYSWYGENYSYYAYDTGTLAIDMLDAKNADVNSKRIPVLWTGVNSGILSGNRIYLCERLERSINQCFMQSPYLRATK